MGIRFSLPPEPGYGAVVSAETDDGTVYFRRVSEHGLMPWDEVDGPDDALSSDQGYWSWTDVLFEGPVELIRTGRTEWPIAIDPRGCGCTECITGEYVPLNQATDEQIRLMLAGEIACNLPDDTQVVTRVTVSAGNPVMPVTVVTHTETVGGEK
ncbi:hypothetical protein [Kineosporia babensis]|uniref:Uncharacterized protein n=1 Tax=Kineosporia babensis TaxID=499548 RepID=A0A9X1SSU1_9ACTN|nr:hypothetical protein [Kineosporia babensis]MCD5310929.1 hypothetical protein [Kineosporia babensis]